MDDIELEFDSLRSSFNLKRDGLFYSLTLTEGVSSNVIRPENNIIVSLNGIIQEPGVAYEIVGSRVIFAEVLAQDQPSLDSLILDLTLT